MSFMFPLGLLGLIGVPVIIIIYIIQSKYTEQTVNSNYLWHLSDKFMKRKNPLSGITGIISLFLQLLMVVAISLIISRPIITLPNAAKDYCFVVDASSSMTMVEGEETRFDLAKEEIERIIKKSKNSIKKYNEPQVLLDLQYSSLSKVSLHLSTVNQKIQIIKCIFIYSSNFVSDNNRSKRGESKRICTYSNNIVRNSYRI